MKILTIIRCFRPGARFGGPVRSLENMVENIRSVKFDIYTADRDLGDTDPYESVVRDAWTTSGMARLFYASPRNRRSWALRNLVKNTDHDVLYLNGLFEPDTRRIFWLLWMRLIDQGKTILAPHGVLSPGALAIKKRKKMLFLRLLRFSGACRRVTWHAASSDEAQNIRHHFGEDARVFIAPAIPANSKHDESQRDLKKAGRLRLIYLSSISRNKNLHLTLEFLSRIPSNIEVDFDIFGPILDRAYWNSCQTAINKMPSHVRVAYKGAVSADQVLGIFPFYDLFVLLTEGENYGHVIAESLASGTPVLISDQTPWRNLEEKAAGWVLRLDDEGGVVDVFVSVGEMDESDHSRLRKGAKNYISERQKSGKAIEAHVNMFTEVGMWGSRKSRSATAP